LYSFFFLLVGFDTWLAADPHAARHGALRIVFPRDGDVFVRNPVSNGLQSREQEIALRATGARTVAWSINGKAVPLDASGTAFMPVRVGAWTIEASDGHVSDRVRIRVVPRSRNARPGFTW